MKTIVHEKRKLLKSDKDKYSGTWNIKKWFWGIKVKDRTEILEIDESEVINNKVGFNK